MTCFPKALKLTLFIFVLLISIPTRYAQSQQLGNQEAVFPDSVWMQYAEPEEAGWSSAKIDEVKNFADSLGSDAVMLIYNGAVVSKWGHISEIEFIASIYKSLFNSLYGISVAKGEIDTSATLAELGIEAKPPLSKTEKRAKVVHLLSASSGVYRQPDGQGPVRGSAKPGEQWFYNGWDFNALGTIYEQETGRNVFQALKTFIAKPIGMQDYEPRWGHYFSQPWASNHPSYNIWMSARDLARFGLLYLREGRWKDKQVIPTDWIKTSTTPSFSNVFGEDLPVSYGLLWWIRGGALAPYNAYFASGVGNQSIWVLPKLNMVFVHRASRDYNQGVSGLDVEEVLLRLIQAKTGTPKVQPKLIPMKNGDP